VVLLCIAVVYYKVHQKHLEDLAEEKNNKKGSKDSG
jgi:hypothetical protein